MTADQVRKYDNRTTPWLKKRAQTIFNKWIRERDRQETFYTCISCGQTKRITGNQYQAGHYFSAGEYNGLRFHEHNTNGECKHCNYFRGDHLIGYRENLIKKIGKKAFETLVWKAARSKRKVKKWHRLELIEIIEKYK